MHKYMTALALCLAAAASAQDATDDYDYFAHNRLMIRNGVQAVLMCNGLFTSHRSIEQVFHQELAYLSAPVGNAEGGNYRVDDELKAVMVGGGAEGPIIRAAFRAGIGCVVMAPDQDWTDIDRLPKQDMPPPRGNPARIPWPNGDLVKQQPLPNTIDAQKLQAASDWAFDRHTPEQDTLSLMVLHQGSIIHERYANGVDMHTRTRTWSTAKSIAATLIGMLVDEGRLSLDASLGIDWLPAVAAPADDPRHSISLQHMPQADTVPRVICWRCHSGQPVDVQ